MKTGAAEQAMPKLSSDPLNRPNGQRIVVLSGETPEMRPELNVRTRTLEKPRDATRVDKTVEFLRRDETRARQPVARNRLNI